jgi:hypothetical protein
MSYVVVFSMSNGMTPEMIVRFVDIDGIIDHYCLTLFS